PRSGENAIEIPDGLGGIGEVVGEEAAKFFLAENSGVAPLGVFEGTDIENVDHQKVARLGAAYAYGAREMVAGCEVDIANVVGAVVVFDLPAGPVEAFHPE